LCNHSITLTSSSTSGNQWYLKGNPIDGATNQNYLATVPGDYTVVVTSGGCPSPPAAATTVSENPAPVLSYPDQTVPFTASLTISPATGPQDNTNISSILL